MSEYKYTKEQCLARKEQRREIHRVILEFVNLSDDYWISFKKMRKVFKHIDDAQAFFAPYVGKNGKVNAKKFNSLKKALDEEYSIFLANKATETPSSKNKTNVSSNLNDSNGQSILIEERVSASVKKPRRARLSEEQVKELEKLRSEKLKTNNNRK